MATKNDSPETKKVQKAAAEVKKPAIQRDSSPAVEQSGLGQPIDSAQQLSAADMVDMHQTYGNSFAQRLMGEGGDGGRETRDEGQSSSQNPKSKIQNSQPSVAMRESDDPAGGRAVDEETESHIQRTRGQGSGLPGGVKGQMEGQFGADFSNVRLHTDGQADQLSRSINARSFTTGSDIYFQQGEYNPSSQDGQQLLAHELTHVVQQGGGAQRKPIQRKLTVNEPGDQYEQEADAMAEQVVKAPTAAPPAGGAPPPAEASGKAPAEPRGATAMLDNTGQGANLDDAKKMMENPAVADAVEQAKDQAKGDVGTDGAAMQEAAKAGTAATGQAPTTPEQQTGEQVAEAKQAGQETTEEVGEKKEDKEEEKEDPEEKAKDQEVKEQGGKLEQEDDSQIKNLKFDPTSITETEDGPRLPTWSQLAYGTIQMDADAGLVEQEKAERETLSDVPEASPAEATPAAAEPAAEPVPAAEMDRGKMIMDAIGTGLLQGVTSGAQEMVVDKFFDFATTHGPAKNIPYVDGLMAIGQIAMDPNGWWEGGFGQTVSAFKDEGVFGGKGAWASIGKEKTWAGKLAGVCEALVATIDWLNAILGAVQQVLTIILFILGVTAAILTATGVAAAAAAVILKIIAFIEKILMILAKITDFLVYGIKPPVQLIGIIFRAVDIAIFEGDPDELMAKQQKLTNSVMGFTKDATQRGIQKGYEKGVDKFDSKMMDSAKAKKRKAIESVDDTTAPPGKKKQDLVDAYESKYGTSYEGDAKRKSKEALTDSDRLADLGAQKKKAQRELDETTKFKKKDGTAVDDVGAKRAQKQLDEANASFDTAKTRSDTMKTDALGDATYQNKVATENTAITDGFNTQKSQLDTAKNTADTAAPTTRTQHDDTINAKATDVTTATTAKTTADTEKSTADTAVTTAKRERDDTATSLKDAKKEQKQALQEQKAVAKKKNATQSEKDAAKKKVDDSAKKVSDTTSELTTKQAALQTKTQEQAAAATKANQAKVDLEAKTKAKTDADKAKVDFEAAETARLKKYDDDVKAAEAQRDADLRQKKTEQENAYEQQWQKKRTEDAKQAMEASQTPRDATAQEHATKVQAKKDADQEVATAKKKIDDETAIIGKADADKTAAEKAITDADGALPGAKTTYDTAKAKREDLENKVAAETDASKKKQLQKELKKSQKEELKADAKHKQLEKAKADAVKAKTDAEQAKTDALGRKTTAETEKTTADTKVTQAETELSTAKTAADAKLDEFKAKQEEFQGKLDELDKINPDEAKLLGKEAAKKTAAEKAAAVFNVLSLGTSGGAVNSLRDGTYRDGTTTKDWRQKGWSGQAHASGVTGGSIGFINSIINLSTGGDIPSMTEWVGNNINFQKGADEYGAAGIEFDTKWPDGVDMNRLRYSTTKFSNSKDSNTLAEVTPDDETKKLWSKDREWPAPVQGVKPKDNPIFAAMPGTYTLEETEKVGLEGQHIYYNPSGEGDYKPELNKTTVTVEAGKKETVQVDFTKYVEPTPAAATPPAAQAKRDERIQRAPANTPPVAIQRAPEEEQDDTSAEVGQQMLKMMLQASQMHQMQAAGLPPGAEIPSGEMSEEEEAPETAEATNTAAIPGLPMPSLNPGTAEILDSDEGETSTAETITASNIMAGTAMEAVDETDSEESEEAFTEEEEEEEEASFGTDPRITALRQKRQREMLDILPEPPDEAEAAVSAAAQGYNIIAAEEEILAMRQQQMEGQKMDAQSQVMEIEGTQKVIAANEMTIGSFEKGTQQKLEGQEKEKQASQEAANPSQKASSESSGMEGLMQGIMAPLIKVFTDIAGKFTDTDTGQAQKDTSQMKNNADKPGETSNMAIQGSNQGISEANERTAKTKKVQSQTEQNKKELAMQDTALEKQKSDALDGAMDLEDLSTEAASTRSSMQTDKDMMATEHDTATSELDEWAIEHETMRLELFNNLDAELAAYEE